MKLELIIFWDHCTGQTTPMLCSVVGYLINETDKNVVMTWWFTHGLEEEDEEFNQEPFVILKSAIIKRFRLRIPTLFFKILSKWATK